MTSEGIGLAGFNELSPAAAEEALLACCAAPTWARVVAGTRPYPTVAALLATADAALAGLGADDLDAALAAHPRIGGPTDSPASAREQAGVGEAERAALAAGNRAYERKFGHRYLVCAAGRGGAELLAVLTARLDHDPATERQVMRTELAKINRLRLARLVARS
ncbi:2-oxo-4-hydroxy-4-carboxy-5-ureidoimidazoline decarboxylase [Nocardia sp. SSK8]|uniref:2-oxo-4-hydroxy-4-carboxy-5-ureidoimidazoline decarboxylase n=1 Tax=Nocardia sp. SSK8 TaxID=3120154 RepID=UPI00300B9815